MHRTKRSEARSTELTNRHDSMDHAEAAERPDGARHPGGAERPSAASRRRFLQMLTAASAAPWAKTLLPGLGLAAAGVVRAQTPAPEEPSATVRALMELVRAQWGERLTQQDLEVIQENLGWMQRSSQALRGVALQNSDEPDVIFRAEKPEDS